MMAGPAPALTTADKLQKISSLWVGRAELKEVNEVRFFCATAGRQLDTSKLCPKATDRIHELYAKFFGK